jgi:mycoredoxin
VLKSDGIHPAVRVYGANWCHDTQRALALMDDMDIQYNYYDIDKDSAMKRTSMALQGGGEKTPVIDFGDGVVLVVPSDSELHDALEKTGRVLV